MQKVLTRPAIVAAVTLALGVSVFAAWSIALGRPAGTGPGTILRDQPVLVLGLVAVLAAAIGAIVGLAAQRWTGKLVAVVLLSAWVGELLVLLLAGRLIANEITPSSAPGLWAMATGGPIQPAAAIVGAWLARSLRRRVPAT